MHGYRPNEKERCHANEHRFPLMTRRQPGRAAAARRASRAGSTRWREERDACITGTYRHVFTVHTRPTRQRGGAAGHLWTAGVTLAAEPAPPSDRAAHALKHERARRASLTTSHSHVHSSPIACRRRKTFEKNMRRNRKAATESCTLTYMSEFTVNYTSMYVCIVYTIYPSGVGALQRDSIHSQHN